MSNNLIEQCLSLEGLEETSEYLQLAIPSNVRFIVVDPFAINIKDLENMKPGEVKIVRVRRPMWGRGDVSRYIKTFEF